MSKRRKEGDWVKLKHGAGMLYEEDMPIAQIQKELDIENPWMPCMLDCGDVHCREWTTLLSDIAPEFGNKRYEIWHVSECQMEDIRK